MKCNCGVCTRQRVLFDTMKNGTADERRSSAEHLLAEIDELEMDRDWNNSVEDGTWPGALEILKRRVAHYTEVIKGLEDGNDLPESAEPANVVGKA